MLEFFARYCTLATCKKSLCVPKKQIDKILFLCRLQVKKIGIVLTYQFDKTIIVIQKMYRKCIRKSNDIHCKDVKLRIQFFVPKRNFTSVASKGIIISSFTWFPLTYKSDLRILNLKNAEMHSTIQT